MEPKLITNPGPIFAQKPYITVVSGLPRSGTSMMMKMLAAGGFEPIIDRQHVLDDDNPEGYYEYQRVKQLKYGDNEWIASIYGKSIKVISYLLKDLPENYHYRIIFMKRHLNELSASQRKLFANRGENISKISDEFLIERFSLHLQSVNNWLEKRKNMQVLYLHYNDLISDPTPYTKQIHQFLDGSVNIENMRAVIDKSLYRNRHFQL